MSDSDNEPPKPPKPTKKTSAVPLKKETVRVTLKAGADSVPTKGAAAAPAAPKPPAPAPTIPLKSAAPTAPGAREATGSRADCAAQDTRRTIRAEVIPSKNGAPAGSRSTGHCGAAESDRATWSSDPEPRCSNRSADSPRFPPNPLREGGRRNSGSHRNAAVRRLFCRRPRSVGLAMCNHFRLGGLGSTF